MENIIWGFIGLGIILGFAIFLIIFGGVEKEDPYITHTLKKSKTAKKH
jgi:hypothetical protein